MQKAYKAMALLVTIGWESYPIGYFMGYMMDSANPDALNIIYNVADLWNKIAFGLVIWAAAIADSEQ